MARLESSKHHRNAARSNAVAEITASALRTITPVAAIPAKFAQMVNSGYMLFRPRPKLHEKIAHGIQCGLAATQIAILITMLYKDESCKTIDSSLCKSLLLTDLFYQGVLLTGWAPAEFFKDERDSIEVSRRNPTTSFSDIETPTESTGSTTPDTDSHQVVTPDISI